MITFDFGIEWRYLLLKPQKNYYNNQKKFPEKKNLHNAFELLLEDIQAFPDIF